MKLSSAIPLNKAEKNQSPNYQTLNISEIETAAKLNTRYGNMKGYNHIDKFPRMTIRTSNRMD